ncbi:hypothetical protein FEI14_13735 [Lacticaseibacillus zeae]|uniref:Uncharacterized protein n=1 Tax=Lacticaseibacillus zeae TaxID=57037 RepID=A0A5R8LNJ3_LACZE|nr:hypothetical protein FEI14_13735 [Lacticaseibacillus zeae]
MASRFDLLNADAPIVTNSPWFGTVLEYSMALVTKTRVVAAVDYKDTVKYQKSASKQVKASCSNYSPPFRLAVFRLIQTFYISFCLHPIHFCILRICSH